MAGTQSTPPQTTSQGETPSPLCNHLLEQVKLRLEDSLSEAELKSGVSEALASLEQAREQTLENLERDGAKDDVLEAFEKSFDDMQIALEAIDEFASGATAESHEAVRLTIFRAANATAYAVTTMQQAQFSEGPTDMPLFNALFKMKEGYLEGGVEGDQLREALTNIVKMTKAAIQELVASEGEQPPQRDGLVRAYEEQIESLERVGETISEGQKDKSEVDDAFAELLRTSNGVKEAMALLNEAIMSQGPCRLARTNVLLSASDTFRAGGIGVEPFGSTLDEFETEIREEKAAVLELSALPNQSEPVAKEIRGVKEAYDLHEEALGMFAEFLDGEGGPEDFEKAQKLLIEASEKLSDHKEALEKLGESEGKVSCVRCGTLNDPNNRVCDSCSAQLPQQAGVGGIASTMDFQEADGSATIGHGELEMTSNLERLFLAVNEIAEERSSDDEFEEVLLWMDNLIVNATATMPEVPNMANNPDYSPELVEQIGQLQEELNGQRDLMLEGMATIRSALNTLQSFTEGRDKNTLVKGVREVRDGAIKMQQSERALALITEALQAAAAEAQAAREAEAQGGGATTESEAVEPPKRDDIG